jgi:hypothetical protein
MKYGSLSKPKQVASSNANASSLNRSMKPKDINIKLTTSNGHPVIAEKDLTKSVIGTFRPGAGHQVTGTKFKTSKNSRKNKQ